MRNLHTHKNTPCERYTTGDQRVVFRHHLYSPKKIKNIQKQTRNDCTVYSIPTSQLTANIILTKQLFCTSTITSSVQYNHRRYHVFAHLTSLVSAAFDTIDHLLCWFGIHGSVLSWFKSYLSSCCFRVKCDTDLSSWYTSSCAILQGSVLGPRLFVMYTTPLSILISSCFLNHHIYADDTQLFLSFLPTHFDSSKDHLHRSNFVLGDCKSSYTELL